MMICILTRDYRCNYHLTDACASTQNQIIIQDINMSA